jgi:Flp pilus assembly protein TadG
MLPVTYPFAPARRPGLDRESGQTLGMFAVFLVALLAMCALAIDAGSWYQQKRAVQAAVDAAALAGASQLSVSQSAATAGAQSQYAKNGLNSDTVTYTVTSDLTTGDSVTVTASRTVSSFFERVFGVNSATVTATARATMESYTGVPANANLMPWGIMKDSFVPGQNYSIYTDGSSPNNGALSLNTWTGTTCTGTSGANDYKNEISGATSICPVSIGDLEPVKTGQNSGPTAQGIDTRITTWDPVTAIASIAQNGSATIIKPTSPQLVLLPVVVNATDGSSTWPSGSGNVRVVGFALFIITGYSQHGKQVDGEYITAQMSQTTWTTGAWTGTGSNTAYTEELTS